MRRRLTALIYRCSAVFTRAVVFSLARWEIEGVDRVPRTGPLILVANHLHLLDPPLVTACVNRRLHPMAKREIFEIPLIGWFFWAYGAFPVRRYSADLGALRVARGYLRDGEAVLMFPEGTRAAGARGDGALRPALPGAAMVALMSQAPVVPVGITGSDVRIPAVFFQWLVRRRPRIRVVFGEPFTVDATTPDAHSAEAATDQMMRRVAALLPEAQRGVYGAQTVGTIVVQRQHGVGPAAPPAAAPTDR